MRRVPKALWLLAPLVVGLLYAAGHAVLTPRPPLENLPPGDAVLVQRFRDMKAFDRCAFGPRGKDLPAPRDAVARARNVPGLPGVDLSRPLHMILMPRTLRPDSTLAVFALADEEVFERAFNRPDLIESGGTRHAQNLVVRGRWAAVGPSRDAARRIGTGGITTKDLGEDHSLVADIPRLAEHAISLAGQYPWRSILTALGVDVDAATRTVDGEKGLRVVTLPGMDRALRLGEVWKTARMWVWMDRRRLRVDLEPQPGRLHEGLSKCEDRPVQTDALPPVPAEAVIRITTRNVYATLVLIWAAEGCGVRLPDGVSNIAPHMTGMESTAMLAWAVPAPGAPNDLTIGLATASSASVGFVGPLLPPEKDRVRAEHDGHILLAFGGAARRALDRMRARGAPNRALTATQAPPLEEGFLEIATFAMSAKQAQRILGRALLPGGFLACLAEGNVHGALSTDGSLLRLEVWTEG